MDKIFKTKTREYTIRAELDKRIYFPFPIICIYWNYTFTIELHVICWGVGLRVEKIEERTNDIIL